MTIFIRTRIIQTGAVFAAALLAAGAAAPLQAAASQQAQARPPQNANSAAERRICVLLEMSGTRVPRRVCRTQAEWDRAGGVPSND